MDETMLDQTTQAPAEQGPTSLWPRKKHLTPEEYLAFAMGEEMAVARRRAVQRFAGIGVPFAMRNEIAAILAELTQATIDAYFDFDKEAVSAYILTQRPDIAARWKARQERVDLDNTPLDRGEAEALVELLEAAAPGLTVEMIEGKTTHEAAEVILQRMKNAVPSDQTQH